MAFCDCNFCSVLGSDALRLFRKVVGDIGLASSSSGGDAVKGSKLQSGGRGLEHRKNSRSRSKYSTVATGEDSDLRFSNIISNSEFTNGAKGWFGMGCSLAVGSYRGTRCCIAKGRTDKNHGPAQEIGKRLDTGVEYYLKAWVRVRGGQAEEASVKATMKLENSNCQRSSIQLTSMTVKKWKWSLLTATLLVTDHPISAIVCFHGPDSGVGFEIARVAIIPLSSFNTRNLNLKKKKSTLRGRGGLPEDPKYGVNIVSDTNLGKGLGSWYPLGNCDLTIRSGGPTELGICGRNSFVNTDAPVLSGNYIHAANRTETWEGPAQDITSEVQLFNSYQVSGWVAVIDTREEESLEPQEVNVALDVDGEWMTGGEVAATSTWVEIKGSFRLETQPKEVIVYFQGPDPGVDLKVGGLFIFAVDRLARTPTLQESTDKYRKRDVVLRFHDKERQLLQPGTQVLVQQEKNSYPIGSAINRESLSEGPYRDFFLSHFNWAVFESEFKWDQIEPDEDEVDLQDVDDMMAFCNANEISMRGHCLLWENEEYVQDWVKELDGDELLAAVEEHIRRLIARYKGEFKHFDVNNEILHGSFYEDKLGALALPYFFKLAHHCDPKARLFLNDYHILDGYDAESSPQEYFALAQFMLENGAPVGGLGVQGHLNVPIGPIIQRGLDLLSPLGLPIWFTELDVSSLNEFVRAEDLEVALREAFAHPAVDGCLFWGFWEDAMYLENAHLVDADGTINAAGRRLLALKEEWRTNFEGVVDENGELRFRGFFGRYKLYIPGASTRLIEVKKGISEVTIDVKVV